jgi:hypothetical protein
MGSTSLCRAWYRYPTLIAAAAVLAALGGCGGGGSSGSASASTSSAGSTSTAGASTSPGTGTGAAAPSPSTALALTGIPAPAVAVGSVYNFQPAVAPATGATVGYSIQNLPTWATFSTATGQLLGTPTAANVGVYPNIMITASTGSASASLQAFAVTVQSSAQPNTPGTATLSWVAPTTNSDNTQLDDLSAFRIYYGTSSSSLTSVIDVVADGNTDGFIVSGLAKGTYYFKVSALDSSGVESTQSNEVSKGVS